MITLAEYPELLKQWDFSKNSDNPKNISHRGGGKYWWKCPIADDHEWEAVVANRTNGSGCPCCRGLKVVLSNCLATRFPELSKEWHPSKNGKITTYNVTAGSKKLVWWICDKGHEWKANICARGRGNGCPYCANKKACIENCLATRYPNLTSQWHPHKNGSLTVYDILPGSQKKYWWLCGKGHEWQAKPNDRTNAQSECPYCYEFKGETKIRQYLENKNIKFKTQHRLKRIGRFDFTTHNSLIEYNGQQHYIPTNFGSKKHKAGLLNLIDNVRRDHKKKYWHQKIGIKKGIRFLIIPYWEYEYIEKILDDFFASNNPKISNPPEIVKKYELMQSKILKRLGFNPEI